MSERDAQTVPMIMRVSGMRISAESGKSLQLCQAYKLGHNVDKPCFLWAHIGSYSYVRECMFSVMIAGHALHGLGYGPFFAYCEHGLLPLWSGMLRFLHA